MEENLESGILLSTLQLELLLLLSQWVRGDKVQEMGFLPTQGKAVQNISRVPFVYFEWGRPQMKFLKTKLYWGHS
jgi:hypothetical protein